jgi:hypothetical protein
VEAGNVVHSLLEMVGKDLAILSIAFERKEERVRRMNELVIQAYEIVVVRRVTVEIWHGDGVFAEVVVPPSLRVRQRCRCWRLPLGF